MKFRVLLYICILFSLFGILSKDPQINESRLITLKPEDVGDWIKTLQKDINACIGNKAYDELYSFEPKFKISLEGVPDSVRYQYRYICGFYAYQMKEKHGDFSTALEYYLLAHKNVADPVKLDRLSWHIENEIATIYTRYGDYDRSDYFARLVEGSLIDQRKYETLSRLYTNMGIAMESAERSRDAIQFFVQGLRIADSLQYSLGIFANCLSLGEIYTDQKEDSLASIFLLRAEDVLLNLINDSKYQEKKSGLESAIGDLASLKNEYATGI